MTQENKEDKVKERIDLEEQFDEIIKLEKGDSHFCKRMRCAKKLSEQSYHYYPK